MKTIPIHYGLIKQFPQGKGYVRFCDNKSPKDDLELMAINIEDVSCKRCLRKLKGSVK